LARAAQDDALVIALSIVIPTHNRAERLRQNLLALTRQTAAPDVYEIGVVADGCTDGTAGMVADVAATTPVRLVVITQSPSGAAAARNLGAASASAAVLLFLDDDMEAPPDLVSAHIAAHRHRPRTVVIGRFSTPADPTASLLSKDARRWWADRAAARSRPDHRFTFLDVCTGHLSMSRELFDQAGGFDPRFAADMSGEDFELGIRLARIGAHFVYASDAVTVHHDRPTPQRVLTRAEQDGRGQSVLTQRHPELFWQFAFRHLGGISEKWPLEPVSTLLWWWPGLGRPLARGMVWAAAAAELCGRSGIARRLHGVVHRYHYFLGARSVIASQSAWQRLKQEAPLEPAGARELEIDLALGFERLDGVLAAARPDAVRVSHRDTPILRVEPIFGAEPIRGVHVRRELLDRAPGLVLGLMLEDHGTPTAAA
jgi:GT2 family glycosyltransferase